jgi:hypothetical protein
MTYVVAAGQPVNLKPTIVGNGGYGALADFHLYAIAADGSQTVVPYIDGNYMVAAAGGGTTVALRLDTLPAFNGVTSADVLLHVWQGGNVITSTPPPPAGHAADYLYTVTGSGVISPHTFSLFFN